MESDLKLQLQFLEEVKDISFLLLLQIRNSDYLTQEKKNDKKRKKLFFKSFDFVLTCWKTESFLVLQMMRSAH